MTPSQAAVPGGHLFAGRFQQRVQVAHLNIILRVVAEDVDGKRVRVEWFRGVSGRLDAAGGEVTVSSAGEASGG